MNMMDEEEDDELEIGEITERDSPEKIKRPPNDELIEYNRGNKKNEISSSGGVIGGGRGGVQDRRSKRVYALYIVLAILCFSTIFLHFEVTDLGNRSGELENKINELEKLLPPNDNGNVSLDEDIYHINDLATVTVTDNDRNINSKIKDTVKVMVVGTNDSNNISISLTETGMDTGEFTGTFTFASETSDIEEEDIIRVKNNDIIKVIYKDEKTEANKPENRTVNALIKQEEP
jgi:hypothetical protein